MARGSAPLLAPEDVLLLGEKIRAARMYREPVPKSLREEGRQRDAAGCPPVMSPLLLVDSDGAGLQVEVRQPGAQNLGSPGPRMGSEAKGRVDPRLDGRPLYERQQLLNLAKAEEQAVPQLLLFHLVKAAPLDLTLDLLPRLKRRLLRSLRVLEPLVRERAVSSPACTPQFHAARRLAISFRMVVGLRGRLRIPFSFARRATWP